VVAAATLAVAVAFQPARRRVQRLVDRRFSRRRYDAARTIAAFSGRLREQVDLDTLTAELLAVTDRTVEPTTASLWLRPPAERLTPPVDAYASTSPDLIERPAGRDGDGGHERSPCLSPAVGRAIQRQGGRALDLHELTPHSQDGEHPAASPASAPPPTAPSRAAPATRASNAGSHAVACGPRHCQRRR
jgi:hypothetical protein